MQRRQSIRAVAGVLCGVWLFAPVAARAQTLAGEHYPQTRQHILTRAEMQGWSPSQVRYAVNEMYARHGFVFKDLVIRKQFLQFDWYKPVPGRTQQGAEARFNRYERDNLKILTGGAAATSSAPVSSAYPGEHYPATRTRRLSRSEVAQLSGAQVRYAINEMYARHGFVFEDLDIRKQFLQFKWYKPVPGRTQGNIEARLNRYEKANLEMLSSARAYKAFNPFWD